MKKLFQLTEPRWLERIVIHMMSHISGMLTVIRLVVLILCVDRRA